MREVTLPSGAILRLGVAPFAVAKALYQALLKELKEIPISTKEELGTVYQKLFCTGFSSTVVEDALKECFKASLYDGRDGKGALRISDDTFEPENRRQDYMKVCVEVAKENINPFAKSLYAEFQTVLAMTESIPSSK